MTPPPCIHSLPSELDIIQAQAPTLSLGKYEPSLTAKADPFNKEVSSLEVHLVDCILCMNQSNGGFVKETTSYVLISLSSILAFTFDEEFSILM